jgi:hypothetical protein
MVRLVACILYMGACASSGSGTPRRVPASAPMKMSGDRCREDGRCTCRSVDDYNRSGLTEEQAVPEGEKRFEVRTGRGFDTVEVTVEPRGTLRKARELVDASCGYVDLLPGKHHVHLHAKAANENEGMVPAVFMNEWSARTHDWYDTFVFKCGGNGACTKDHLQQWAETDGKKPRGIFDPCGSTRIENLRYEGNYASDVKVLELEVDFDLDVYKFTPRFPHAAKTCKGVGGVEAPEEPKDMPQ